ncbi:MAG: EamA family transporter, partial [Candidatus Geothermincolia bacterium]
MDNTGRFLFSKERGAELALVGITVIWGLTFVFTKNSLKELQPFVFLAWRFAIALIAMAILCIPRYSKMDWKVVGAGAILGVFLFSS